MKEISWQIDVKPTKKGDDKYYIHIDEIGRYEIIDYDVDENGIIYFWFPCLYIPKSFIDTIKYKDGYCDIIEKLSDFGKIEIIEDDKINKLSGNHRIFNNEINTVSERVDGVMAFAFNQNDNTCFFVYGVK